MKNLPKILIVLFAVIVSGCATISTSGGYNLGSGETVRGHLVITSGETNLEHGSLVTGNIYMTSGELDANGEIRGDIIFTSGNVNLGPQAVVGGDIKGTSGNVHMEDGAQVEGQISSNQSTFTLGTGFFASIFTTICLLPLVVIGGLIFLVVLLRRSRQPAPAAPVEGQTLAPSNDPAEALKQLKQMQDDGLITEQDYEAKKAEILANM